MTLIDKLVGIVSPRKELERMRIRMAINEVRKYDAASSGRRTAGWDAVSSSPNTEIGPALAALRNRSRELVRNNSYAKKGIGVIASNTIGVGIRASINVQQEAIKLKIQTAWKDWSDKTECDFGGQLNLYGLQELAMRTVAESGECLIRKRVSKNKTKIPFQLQILEPEYLSLQHDNPVIKGGGFIMQGVEFDKDGKRVAYWIYDRHPSEAFRIQDTRIPAADVIHVYKIERPGQIRGVPFGTSSAIKLRDFADYEDAQLMRQKIAACFAAFVQDASADSTIVSTKADSLPERVEPGMIEHLPAGKTVTFGNPPAAEGYEPYSKKILQGVAAGYGVTYEAMTGDLSNVNFSSGRMGWLEFHKLVEDWQYNMMIPRFCNVVWDWFMNGCVIAGVIGEETSKATTVEWTPPRREMIDPVKEGNGLALQIRNGLTSWSEVVRSLGFDPKELLKEIQSDFELFKKLKIILDCDPNSKLNTVAEKPEEK
jgi:lambda family phage portal protein